MEVGRTNATGFIVTKCKMEVGRTNATGFIVTNAIECIVKPRRIDTSLGLDMHARKPARAKQLLRSSLFLPNLLRPPLLYIISDHSRINVHYLKTPLCHHFDAPSLLYVFLACP